MREAFRAWEQVAQVLELLLHQTQVSAPPRVTEAPLPLTVAPAARVLALLSRTEALFPLALLAMAPK